MRLEAVYRATFTTPESWSVELAGEHGAEAQSFLIAEGRVEGRLSGRYRAANFPRRRTDGTLLPAFRGVLECDDGATILFEWHGYARAVNGAREIVGSISHVTDDERHRWLNTAICAVTGEVRDRSSGHGFDVVIDVAEVVPA
jgi:hypothetical protein